MWPDDFENLLRMAIPLAIEQTARALRPYRVLTMDERQPEAVTHLARDAVRRLLADGLLRTPDTFLPPGVFRRWFSERVYEEALRLLPGHPFVKPWLAVLPAWQRRLLVWLYQDVMTMHQLPRLIAATPEDALAQAKKAYRAFCTLLRRNGWGHDDDLWTFPVPLGLVGRV
jgi:hypothetical protein